MPRYSGDYDLDECVDLVAHETGVGMNAPLLRGLRPARRGAMGQWLGVGWDECPATQGITTRKWRGRKRVCGHSRWDECPATQGITTCVLLTERGNRIISRWDECPATQGITTAEIPARFFSC